MNIKDIVKNNTVRFLRYRKGTAYYGVDVHSYGKHEFPVPLEDVGDATLLDEDKAILFMRYIKRALDDGTFVRYAER